MRKTDALKPGIAFAGATSMLHVTSSSGKPLLLLSLSSCLLLCRLGMVPRPTYYYADTLTCSGTDQGHIERIRGPLFRSANFIV